MEVRAMADSLTGNKRRRLGRGLRKVAAKEVASEAKGSTDEDSDQELYWVGDEMAVSATGRLRVFVSGLVARGIIAEWLVTFQRQVLGP